MVCLEIIGLSRYWRRISGGVLCVGISQIRGVLIAMELGYAIGRRGGGPFSKGAFLRGPAWRAGGYVFTAGDSEFHATAAGRDRDAHPADAEIPGEGVKMDRLLGARGVFLRASVWRLISPCMIRVAARPDRKRVGRSGGLLVYAAKHGREHRGGVGVGMFFLMT